MHLPEALMTHNAKRLITSFTAERVARVESYQICACCDAKDLNICAKKQPRAQSFFRVPSVPLNMGHKAEVVPPQNLVL